MKWILETEKKEDQNEKQLKEQKRVQEKYF